MFCFVLFPLESTVVTWPYPSGSTTCKSPMAECASDGLGNSRKHTARSTLYCQRRHHMAGSLAQREYICLVERSIMNPSYYMPYNTLTFCLVYEQRGCRSVKILHCCTEIQNKFGGGGLYMKLSRGFGSWTLWSFWDDDSGIEWHREKHLSDQYKCWPSAAVQQHSQVPKYAIIIRTVCKGTWCHANGWHFVRCTTVLPHKGETL